MGFADRSIQCADCGADFIFSNAEQELFASKGYMNDPKRCLQCRQARKTRREVEDPYSFRPRRQMSQVVCAQCGKDCEVPFEPREGRPVYCSDCYNTIRSNR